MANNGYDDGRNQQARTSNVVSSTLIVGCILALIVIAEKDNAFNKASATTQNDSTHYIPVTSHDDTDATEVWLHVELHDSIDGVRITDKDTNNIKLILD